LDRVEIEELEMDLLLDAVFRRYGYDFRDYARASLKRRVHGHMSRVGLESISDLIPLVLRDEAAFQELLFDISVTVTEMFRDPWFFKTLREKIIPFLDTFPFINIWQAGCATGEEVYSLAILLKEEGLYARARIYATDINTSAIEKARARIYPLHRIKEYTQHYQQAGGRFSLSDYYLVKYDAAIFDQSLQENITFASHNLSTDGVFGEMHLILCRNVLIYFDRQLQNHVLETFRGSLRRNGFLCLGSRETLEFSAVQREFECIARDERIYQYKGVTGSLPQQRLPEPRG
jgi:chemotaxis protein methyltransferase CheR